MQEKSHLKVIQIRNVKTLRNYGKWIFLKDVLIILFNIFKQILFGSEAGSSRNVVGNCDEFERRIESDVTLLCYILLYCIAILPFQKFVV